MTEFYWQIENIENMTTKCWSKININKEQNFLSF